MSTELKPCPFCGGSVEIKDEDIFVCNGCEANFSLYSNDIVSEWNRRAPDLAAENERLRDVLDTIGGLSRALRQGGPDPMDLEGLSDALSDAVDLANAALQTTPTSATKPGDRA